MLIFFLPALTEGERPKRKVIMEENYLVVCFVLEQEDLYIEIEGIFVNKDLVLQLFISM